MPRVLPFAGLRYDPAVVADLSQVLSPPYDVISADEQSALQARSPYNAVQLELPADDPDQPGSRYRAAARTLAGWRTHGVLRTDPRPAYYLSETAFSHAGKRYQRRDLLASLAVEGWSATHLLPHEYTMAGPKADRLELLRSTRLNASSIWVLQREPLPAVEDAWTKSEFRAPVVDVTWRDEQHRLWLIDAPDEVEAIRVGFEQSGPLYIADGHHRYETSLAFRAEAEGSVAGASATLVSITWADDPGLLVLPTHRVLRGLDPALTLEEAETDWAGAFHAEYFPVWDNAPAEQVDALMEQLASTGSRSPAFGLLGLGQLDLFALLEVRGRTVPTHLLPADRSDAWKALDVSLLHELLVDPLVARSGQAREQVLGYTRDPQDAFATVRSGDASAAFFLNPTPVPSVLAVADAGDRMPEKSTYFYPKPPAGLVMRDLAAP